MSKEKKKKNYKNDEEIRQLLESRKAIIKVVGVGGAGGNTVDRIAQLGIEGVETVAMNTDAQDLLYTEADSKVLLGKEITRGLGAGADPTRGEDAAKESTEEIKEVLRGCDMVFVTCGLGGGTGTGASSVIADVAKKQGALTIGTVTLPFTMEGKHRATNAKYGLEKLVNTVDTLIVIPNDKLLEVVPDVSINTAFKVADEVLVNAVKGIAELITKPGLINLDFADVRAVMGEGGIAMIGMGESDTENRAYEAVEKALNNPLLSVDINGATGALINVIGGETMTARESQLIVESISKRLDPGAKIIWGAQVNKDMGDKIRAMLVVTGVKSDQIYGNTKPLYLGQAKNIEEALGIDFL
ncbi:MAG: cell division protein FtsZ [Candidatus Aenigmarchaeota archaeon]|nr:cell division protein FtsZ [Candidatus Aenigmarchaeota archaeon]